MSEAPSPGDRTISALRRQLTAYDESWRADHDAAMRCRDVEDYVAIGIGTFHLLDRREQSWRDRVFRGAEEFHPEDEAAIRGDYQSWLATTELVLARVVHFEQQFGTVEGAEELRGCAEKARAALTDWEPPRLSTAVGLRDMMLTPEAARDLRLLLDRAGDTQTPPPRPLRRLPSADPSILKKAPG